MKGFVYLLIFLLLALLFENIIKKFNNTEGLECAPQENSLSSSNAASAKSQNNQIAILKNQILLLRPQILTNTNAITDHKKKIEAALKKVKEKGAAKEAELNKAAGDLKH
jgi:hypothetical protein